MVQIGKLPDLSSGNTTVIIFAKHTKRLLVARLHVKVPWSVLHDGTKSLPISHAEDTVRWDTGRVKSDLKVNVSAVAVNLVDDVRHLHVCGVVARSPRSQLKTIMVILLGNVLSFRFWHFEKINKNVQLCSSWQPEITLWRSGEVSSVLIYL